MSKKTATATAPKAISYEDSLIIEGLRKLALQRDTLVKYAKADGDEERVEALSGDIEVIRTMLTNLGDTKTLVLKSERKAKAKKSAKAKGKTKGVKVARTTKPKGDLITHAIDMGTLKIIEVA